MKKNGNLLIIGIFGWLMSMPMWSQVQLKAQVSKEQVSQNEQFILEYSINKEGTAYFKLPNLNNFEIVQGPSQSVSQSWINGKTSYLASYTYVLLPKRKGVLKIAPASLVYKGKKVFSNAVTIKVSGNSGLSKVPNTATGAGNVNTNQAKKSVHLVTVVDKEQLYVGEPTYVEYRLYMSNVGVSINKFNKLGTYEGFWVHDFTDQQTIRKETVYQGVPSVYYVLKRSLLIPQKSGNLSIEPMEANIAVEVPTGEVDFFGEMITKTVNQTYQSAKKIIKVKRLPTVGVPAGYNGAVGDFKLEILPSKKPYQTNQSNQLSMKISGKGNFKLFDFPGITTAKTIEVYPPVMKENLEINNNGIIGSIIQEYTMVPNQKGYFSVTGEPFSYFNPKDEKYHTISSQQVNIKVLQGKTLPLINESGLNLKDISTNAIIQPQKTTIYNTIYYWCAVLLGLLLIPITGWYFYQNKKKLAYLKANPKLTALQKSENLLAQSFLYLGQKSIFYDNLNEALMGYLSIMLGLAKQQLSKENIKTQLNLKSVPHLEIDKVINLITTIEMVQYAPVAKMQMEADLKETQLVLALLHKYLS